MIFWVKFFSFILLLTIISWFYFFDNLLSFILTAEFILVLIFFIFLFNSLIYNINWIFGFIFIILILGGLELALSFLMLNL